MRRFTNITWLAALSACAVLSACTSDTVGAGSANLAVCPGSDCGPDLGAPTVVCSDGTVGGPTGRCVRSGSDPCGWEFRGCPVPGGDCTPRDCGPLALPQFARADGCTPAADRCERAPDGTCQWHIIDCPPAPPPGSCVPGDCGVAPATPLRVCADGISYEGFTGRCIPEPTSASGCGWEFASCPGSGGTVPGGDCAPSECGPAPLAPVCVCPDGSAGCNTGACTRDRAGTCRWEYRACPPGGGPPPACDCGPAPAFTRLCPDGISTSYADRCLEAIDGTCRWHIVECPPATSMCTAAECGVPPGAPAYSCPDGSTGGFTGRCIPDPAGTCGWEFVDCPTAPPAR